MKQAKRQKDRVRTERVLGRALANARAISGRTQGDVAAVCDVSVVVVSMWENCRRTPFPRHLWPIAALLAPGGEVALLVEMCREAAPRSGWSTAIDVLGIPSERARAADMPGETELSRVLRAARLRRGAHQADVGRVCGVSHETVCRWEAGTREPNTWHLWPIAALLAPRGEAALLVEMCRAAAADQPAANAADILARRAAV